MDMCEWHEEEDRSRKELKRRKPNHPLLKVFFSSTYEACEEYWKALAELDKIEREKGNKLRTKKEEKSFFEEWDKVIKKLTSERGKKRK